MTHPALLKESVTLFADRNRWDAFIELSTARESIITHWLTLGTAGLREHLQASLPKEWKMIAWGSDTDTRCYLREHGKDSLSVGIGWRTEFHLFWAGENAACDRLQEAWKAARFDLLRVLFPEEPSGRDRRNSLGCERGRFALQNPFIPDPTVEDLAWAAAHVTGEFVAATAAKIERVTSDGALTALIHELNIAAFAPS